MFNPVTQWLEQLGLGQYVEAFEENAIGLEHLAELDHDTLKEIGVRAVGHRMTILKAAANPEVQVDTEAARKTDLACFGFPQAHEDDAERAIHAGLGVAHEISGLNETVGSTHGVELGVRVGIATSPVVVGDLIGEGASQESAVVGETPNRAARLQALASRNAVVIGPGTYELVTGRFECENLGDHELKGIAEPIRERTAPEEPIRLRYQCSPFHTNSAFHPIVEQLARAAHFAIEDSPEARLDKRKVSRCW